jgi:hypothetical protein
MVGVDAALFADATGLDPLEETGLGAFLLGRPDKAYPAGR